MDKVDQAIIKYLQQDGRAPYLEIASKLGMSEAAVRRRVKNLVKNGVIRKFTIDLQASQIASALTLVAVTPGSPTSEVADKIKLLPAVRKVNEITGQYDIAITIEAFSMEEVNNTIDQIRKTEGVASTNTMVILREVV
ncbi:MAG: Lrp/AsnC family transcriptional regulator [Conexivisphaerales archaeon]